MKFSFRQPIAFNWNELFASRLFVVSVTLFYIFVAYNSVGFHHYDEHFQIIEFSNYKMGWIAKSKLTWEFREKIRSGLQPFLCYVVFQVSNFFQENDGYNLAFILRSISGVCSILVIAAFNNSCKQQISEKLWPFLVFLSYFLWFIPYISVRFSSETWSGICVLLSLAIILKSKQGFNGKVLFIAGASIGLSILFRYQSAFFAVGMICWLMFIGKATINQLSLFCGAIIFILVLGVIIDFWLYGELTLAIINYFYINVIMGVAAHFGAAPWYEIMVYVVKAPGPFGILLFLAFFILLYFEPKNLVLWTIIPFIIAHALTPHKELRFLFPLANLAPYIFVLSFQYLDERFIRGRIKLAILAGILLLINIPGLVAISLTGASNQVAVSNFIHRNYKDKQVHLILNDWIDPYIDGPPLYNTFYDGKGISKTGIRTFWQKNFLEHRRRGFTNLLILSDEDYTGPQTLELFKSYKLVKVYQNIPDVVKIIYNWYDSSLNESGILVYEFK